MKRIEFLINQIRRSTHNKNTNKLTNQDIVNFFNRAQELIQEIIMTSNPSGLNLNSLSFISAVQDQEAYDLPVDIYMDNSITSVRVSVDSTNYFPIDKNTEKQRFRQNGYSIIDKKIYICPVPRQNYTNHIELTYTRQIKKLGFRAGTVSSYNAGTGEMIFSAGHMTDFDQYDDFFCIVDKDGVIKNSGLRINSFDNATHKVMTDTGLTITNGDFAVIGKYSTTHSELPDACEPYLLSLVERKVFHNDSVVDVSNQQAFTNEERQSIMEIFGSNNKDAIRPPITNTDVLWL